MQRSLSGARVECRIRQRKRMITHSARILHPDEPERPFRSDEGEPTWLADELRPPDL
jgi:hypothetical protein